MTMDQMVRPTQKWRQGHVARPAQDLIVRAERELAAARSSADSATAYLHGHLAALRYAAAVIAAVGPQPRRGSRSAWHQLERIDPRFGRWARTFEESSRTRAALESGIIDTVSDADVARCIADAEAWGIEVYEYVETLDAAPANEHATTRRAS